MLFRLREFISQVPDLILKKQNGSIIIIFRARDNKQLAMEFREILRAKGIHQDIVHLEKLVGSG